MLDQDIVNLAKAIRQHETGNRPVKGASGELASRYQYLPSTWKGTAAKYLGNANAPLTLENENKATYLKLLDWKKSGYNPGQIASMWNSGKPEWDGNVGVNKSGVKYDVPKYVNSVMSLYKQEKARNGSSQDLYKASQPEQPNPYNANQPASPQDTVGQSVQKAISNTPSSLFGFAKGIAELFTGITAGKAIYEGAKSLIADQTPQQNYMPPSVGDVIKGMPSAAYQTLVPESIRQTISGNFGGARQTLVNDPAGQILPILGAASLVKGKLSTKTAEVKPSILKTTAEAIGKKVKPIAEYVTSKATGLEPETIKQVVSQPERFTPDQLALYDRQHLANSVMDNITKLIEEKKDTGSGYNVVRESPAIATLLKSDISSALGEFGIKLSKDNKLITDRNTRPMSSTDISGIQKFIDDYIDKTDTTKLTANQTLNAREAIDNLKNYDATKTKTSEAVATSLRRVVDKVAKDQLPGLAKLDADYSPKVAQYKQIQKDFLEVKNGEASFKPTALTKIANATNKGRESVLKTLEEIKPGITEDINILKAMEDIQKAEGNKVGTYMRVLPTAGGYAAGGVIGGVIAAIMSSPQVIIPLLRMLGTAAGAESGFVSGLITKMKLGKSLTPVEREFIIDAIKFGTLVNSLHQQETQSSDNQQDDGNSGVNDAGNNQ